MPLTLNQIAMIHKKEASLPDALKRDPLTDYFEGWFFVTLNTRDEAPILSTCEGSPSIEDGKPRAPMCRYTKLGEGVMKCWRQIPKFYPNVEVDMCEVMPEHFHGLLYMHYVPKKHLGKVIGGFMIGCTHEYWDSLGIKWREMKSSEASGSTSINTGAIALDAGKKGMNDPEWQDRYHTRSYRGPALFTRGYNDVEPITPEQVQIKRDYIRDQARKRLIQGEHRDCFHIFRSKHSRNWRMDVALAAIAKDPYFARNAAKREEAQRKVSERLECTITATNQQSTEQTNTTHLSGGASYTPTPITQHPSPTLSYLGNASIMAAKRKLPLICHRADAHLFDRQKDAVLNAAREGAVIVSAFISPKERDIREQLMIELLPFIEIMDNGFAERYKPIGKAFYAVAENRMVQISPWTYQYEKDTQISREMCMVMNELARVITGVKDDWWK